MRRHWDYTLFIPLVWFLSLFKKEPPPVSAVPLEKILLIKLAAVGDAVLLIPVIRALKKALPRARIHWLASPINIDIAATTPYIDGVKKLDTFAPGNLLQVVKDLRREAYDVVVDLEQWARGTALLCYFSKAPLRLGFDTPGQHRTRLYTHVYPKTFSQHEIKDFFHLMELLTPLEDDLELELRETTGGVEELYSLVPQLKDSSPGVLRILIHPGCGMDGLPREWPLKNYRRVISWLSQHYPVRFFLTGGPEETEKSQILMSGHPDFMVDLAGKLSWQGMIALTQRMDLVLSGNTGIMHIAAALKKRQIALHGPTDSRLWGPLNDRAAIIWSPCPECPSLKLGFEYHRYDQECMKKISVEEVLTVIQDQLRDWSPQT